MRSVWTGVWIGALLLPLLRGQPQFFLAQAAAKSKAAAYVADARPWEHEVSDLAPDARINFGSFKNGLRYAWVRNNNPPKQVKLRLHMAVGSVAEGRDELGLAHFLEHMAFNGSKNFKAGTLVPFFQGQGIRFGSDVNAHTSFLETVYELDLPDAEPKRLEKAFLWFRDVIDGLKLEPSEIQAEKGVVDAEQTMRDNPGLALAFEAIGHLLDGSRLPRRFPIGEQAVRAKFDKKICTAFYDRWYRPENATFIVVGDLADDPKPLIEKIFGDARGRGEWEEIPGSDAEHVTGKQALFTLFGGGGEVSLLVGKMIGGERPADDVKSRSTELALGLACDVVESRMNELVPRPYVVASVGSGDAFHPAREIVGLPVLRGISFKLQTTPEGWPGALQCTERAVRNLLERGITEAELAAARTRLDQALVARPLFPPPSNDDFLGEIVRACNEHYVPMEDRAAKEVLRKAAKALDPEACVRAFKSTWEGGLLFLCTIGALDMKDSARETFEAAWKESQATNVGTKVAVREDLSVRAPKRPHHGAGDAAGAEPPAPDPDAKGDAKKYAGALPDQDVAGAEIEALNDLHAIRADFKNGVRAFVKFVPGTSARFLFEVRVGEGSSALEPAQADVAKVASLFLLEGGTGKNGHDDLVAALTQAGAGLSFSVEGDGCVFSGSATGAGGEAGLRRALEVVHAYLTDAALAPAAFDAFRKQLPALLPDSDRPTYHNASLRFDQQLANGDARFLPLTRAGAEKVTLDQVKAFLQSQLDGPIDVTVVGELFADKQMRHVGSTLGQLAARRAALPIPAARLAAPPPKSGIDFAAGAVDLAGKVTLLRIVYPATDAIDADAERRLDLLGDVVSDRLRADIREKLGTTYSPRARASGDACWRGRGFVDLELQVDPAKLATTKEACLVSMELLAKGGVKKEEFERLRAARIGNPEALARDFDFWLRQLHRALNSPALVDELRDLPHWYAHVTLDQINAMAKSIFPRERASLLEVTPR